MTDTIVTPLAPEMLVWLISNLVHHQIGHRITRGSFAPPCLWIDID